MKPTRRPANPCFSSGPCAKRPGWSPRVLEAALAGRSHRSGVGLARIVEVVDRSRAILGLPADWRVGIVAGSDPRREFEETRLKLQTMAWALGAKR